MALTEEPEARQAGLNLHELKAILAGWSYSPRDDKYFPAPPHSSHEGNRAEFSKQKSETITHIDVDEEDQKDDDADSDSDIVIVEVNLTT